MVIGADGQHPRRSQQLLRRLFLHNNLTREKSEFQPANAVLITVYVCGPTVYGPAHIGNARPAVVFDVLVRLVRELYPAVSYARNITDIDDKINTAAAEEGGDIKVITDRYRAKYLCQAGHGSNLDC